MAQAATVIAFPGVSLPQARKPRRLTKAGLDNTLLFELSVLSDSLRKTTDALQLRIDELKIRINT